MARGVIAEAAAGEPDASVRRAAVLVIGQFIEPEYRWAVERGARDAGAGLSSLGINVFAYEYPFSADKIVLLDYEQLRADPDAGDFQQQLNDAARHLGRLNLLFADGSVRIMRPAAIRVAAELWKP